MPTVIETRPDRRIAERRWIAFANEGVAVMDCLSGALKSLLACCDHHAVMVESYSAMAEDFMVASEAWKAGRLDEALQKSRELIERTQDLTKLSKEIYVQVTKTAACVSEGVDKLAGTLTVVR